MLKTTKIHCNENFTTHWMGCKPYRSITNKESSVVQENWYRRVKVLYIYFDQIPNMFKGIEIVLSRRAGKYVSVFGLLIQLLWYSLIKTAWLIVLLKPKNKIIRGMLKKIKQYHTAILVVLVTKDDGIYFTEDSIPLNTVAVPIRKTTSRLNYNFCARQI